jgi:hypothetical protein
VKFKKRFEGSAQLRLADTEGEELVIDSYRGTLDDGKDYQFIVMLGQKVFGLTRKQARKIAVAILKEEGK